MEAYRNSLNSANRDFNKTKKLNELALEYRYHLKAIKSVNTKFGISKVATLVDQDLCTLIDVFLPPRYNDKEFNMIYNHYLVYHGKKQMLARVAQGEARREGQDFHDI